MQLGSYSDKARVWKTGFSILGRGKKFFPIQKVQPCSETEPVNIYRGFFLRGYGRSGRAYYDYSAACSAEAQSKWLCTVHCTSCAEVTSPDENVEIRTCYCI